MSRIRYMLFWLSDDGYQERLRRIDVKMRLAQLHDTRPFAPAAPMTIKV